jgi:signal peptidase I
MKKFFLGVLDTAKTILFALAIVLPIRYFLFQPFIVSGDSMVPTFHTGDYLIVDQISYRFREPMRGEIIVFRYPRDVSHRYIKRIIGLPGETVEVSDGKVKIINNEEEVVLVEEYLSVDATTGQALSVLGPDQYFVLGDNRYASSDSRRWGVLDEEYIIGRSLIRLFPQTRIFAAPEYINI